MSNIVIKTDWDRPHSVARGIYYYPNIGDQSEECGCGFTATSIKEHVERANNLTIECLKELDDSKHISYWCADHDHCCCTDIDWSRCNCPCHKDDSEERHCRVRLDRWRIARRMASAKLASKG